MEMAGFNPMWTLNAIMNDRVEEKMIAKFPMNVFARADLMVVLLHVLNDLKTETGLYSVYILYS